MVEINANLNYSLKVLSFVLPYESTVTGLTINATQQQLNGRYYIFPTQPPRVLDGSDPPPFAEPNSAVYYSNAPYPNKTVEIISDGYTHGYHVVAVAIYPIEYHPFNREIYLRDISFTINYTNSFDNKSSITFEKQSYKRAELGKQFVQNLVENSGDIENCKNNRVQIIHNGLCQDSANLDRGGSTSAIDALVPDYIIITNNDLKPKFQVLANWKTKKGVPAIIKTVEEIAQEYRGSDLQEKIRNYLKEAYSRWGASLFVLLGGDTNIVPARLFHKTSYATDLYYATVEGTWNAYNNDIFGEREYIYVNGIRIFANDEADYGYDFFLGRASVKNVEESQVFVNKVIDYEKANNIPSESLGYFKNILVAAAFLDNDCGTRYSEFKVGMKINYENNSPNIKKYYMFDDNYCIGQYYAYCKRFNSNADYCDKVLCISGEDTIKIPDISTQRGACVDGDEEFDRFHFRTALNNGRNLGSGIERFHIIYHDDHSNIKAMGTSSKDKNESINNSHFDNLTNGNYQQIMFSTGCKPATFNYDCIAEHFINNPNNGGVAFIGNSDNGYFPEWVQFGKFLNGLYQNNDYNLGVAFQQAPDNEFCERRRLTLLGDPEMPVWTATPQTLPVIVSLTSANPNTGEMVATVTINTPFPSNEMATICLRKENEYYEVRSGTRGAHSFTFLPHTSGTLHVTVTAQNYKPYEWNTNITLTRHIHITNLTFDDDRGGNSIGNGDGQLDAGETVELTIRLKNNATVSATNVLATLSCNRPQTDISISTTTANFGTINAGAIKNSPTKYVFTIGKDVAENLLNDPNPITFTLQIMAQIGTSNYTYYDKFNIDVFAPELELRNQAIISTSNGDNIIEPGERVTINIDLFNAGKAQATGVKAVLMPDNCPYITNCSATQRSYPAIGKYETKTNSTVYQFTASPSYIVGQPLNFKLQVTNEYGRTWDFKFNLLDRPSQIELSGMDFVGDKNSIKVFWTPLSNVQGYNIYRGDADANGNEVGNYQKINTFIFPAAFFNDEGLAELTKYYYKVSAVSLSGNESELSVPLLAWTSYFLIDGFPVSMDRVGFIRSSINAADIDGDGKKEIFASMGVSSSPKSYLIGLRHDGTELFDIDGNPTTHSGFAEVDGDIWCVPAIGDINGDNIPEVISVTRKVGLSGNRLYCHSSQLEEMTNPGNPKLMWSDNATQSYRAPIIADLNNDGTLKSIFYSEYGGINIYNGSGVRLSTIADLGDTYGALAVADIDNNGNKEIIAAYSGTNSGIYIWKHDGSNYKNQQPFYTLPSNLSGYDFIKSSVIVCDLDNDGKKEILTVAFNSSIGKGRVIALEINPNGTYANIWNSTQTITISNGSPTIEIAAGDLDGDGKQEVVVFGSNGIYIWSNCGAIFKFIPLNIGKTEKVTPILADVDGDPEIEIIVVYDQLIDAYKMDGTKVIGFPLHVDEGFVGSSCVADIDNDGKNEIIAGSGNKIYVWKTYGSPNFIEWGCERANPQNTGEHISTPCADVIISSNTTWSTPQTPCGNIVIQSNATLTVQYTTLYMNRNAAITIQPGGKLVVNRGTITNAFPNKMWSGILVHGDQDTSQLSIFQGYIDLKNNSVIENAICAISAGSTNVSGGGIIKATNTIFRNNARAIYYAPYVYNESGNASDNTGTFTQCTFVIDDNNLFSSNGMSFHEHVKMNSVRGVKFSGCNFENQVDCLGKGIYSIDAGYKITPHCTSINSVPGGTDCPCSESGKTPALFNNFSTGILSSNTGNPHQIHIDQSKFDSNFIAMNIISSDNYRLTRTEFANIRYIGLQSANSSGYRIEENSFQSYSRMYTGVTGTTGIEMYNSGAADNRIYKNDFDSLYVAISAQGNNSNSSSSCSVSKDIYTPPDELEVMPRGLQFICNYFDRNSYDIGIETFSTVCRLQGSIAKGADNKFIRTIKHDLYIGNMQNIIYYHNSLDASRIPSKAYLNSCSTINSGATANDCASTFCISSGGVVSKNSDESDIEKYKIMQEEYDFLAAEYEKNEYGYVLANPDEYPKELVAAAMECLAQLQELSEMMYAMSTKAVHAILQDSVLHTKQLKEWYTIIRTPVAKYLLAEAHAFTKDYEKAESVLKNMSELFKFGESEKKEHDNYLKFFNFKKKMTLSGRNWANLKEDEVKELENIAQATCGRSATMAQGVLCFFFDICKEYEDCRSKEEMNPKIAEAETEFSPENLKEEISIHPNPTTGELTVETHGRASENVALFDIFGRKVFETNENTFNINHLPEGVYIIKIHLENGEIVTRKVVKQ